PEPGTNEPTPLSTWVGEGPQGEIVISFMPENRVIWYFAHDNSRQDWGYTFDTNTNTGTIITGIPWNPAPDGFTKTGNALTILHFGGHSDEYGVTRTFTRLP
ncbi:MAG: hypothetical protein FWC97_11760, partial [Treponema sp.]|nr:hypothetical protein [Treponema sp.]